MWLHMNLTKSPTPVFVVTIMEILTEIVLDLYAFTIISFPVHALERPFYLLVSSLIAHAHAQRFSFHRRDF